MFVSACEAWGYPMGFGVGVCHTEEIVYNLEYLAWTVKFLDWMSIN